MSQENDANGLVVPAPAGMREACAPAALAAVSKLTGAGFEAYLAGGCVRDLLRSKPPKDYDICTNATPAEVQRVFPDSVAAGKAFGVVIAKCGGMDFEIATFRIDHDYKDGRRPQSVSFSDARHDAMRRDFTINALFYDPARDTIIDYVDGLADLKAGVVRAVGDPYARFAEDHLRLLRAVRFQATLGFRLDDKTADAVRANAGQLSRIAAERIRDEFARIITESIKPGDAVQLLDALSLLEVFMPEVCAMKGQEQPADLHPEGDVFTHTVKMLNLMKTDDIRLAFSVLLHDVGKPSTAKLIDGRIRFHYHAERGAELAAAIMSRFRMSTNDAEAICHIIRDHSRMTNVRDMKLSTLRKLIGGPTFSQELELHRLDRLASTGDTSTHAFLVETAERMRNEPILPRPWITGRDIMSLGVPEGPSVGLWREKAYDLQLEGRYADRDALLGWLTAEIAASSSSPHA